MDAAETDPWAGSQRAPPVSKLPPSITIRLRRPPATMNTRKATNLDCLDGMNPRGAPELEVFRQQPG